MLNIAFTHAELDMQWLAESGKVMQNQNLSIHVILHHVLWIW